MRIISGTKRGVRLTTIKNRLIRPTADSTKEVIFNVLNSYIENSFVLDVFAGSGSLGIEALSRGAARAIFIENSQYAQKILFNNLQLTGFIENSDIFRISAEKAFKKLSNSKLKFDLIFADPPYYSPLAQDTISAINQFEILGNGGWLIIEHSGKNELQNNHENLELKVRKKQGESVVSFYQYV